jgi:4'-phosphopantetheinyl transferase
MSTAAKVWVWWMPVGSPSSEAIGQWYASLDGAERARAARFRFEEDRLTYAAAHWLLRTALSSVGSQPPAAWRLMVEQPGGKPRIDPAAGLPMFSFNLSHSRGFVACAISDKAEVGIDVESLERRGMALDVAGRFFSASEVESLRNAPPNEQAVRFFRLWTLKEAFIKATGEGLNRPLDSFSFSLDPVSVDLSYQEEGEAAGWQFFEFRPTLTHLVALAVHQPGGNAVMPIVHSMQAF